VRRARGRSKRVASWCSCAQDGGGEATAAEDASGRARGGGRDGMQGRMRSAILTLGFIAGTKEFLSRVQAKKTEGAERTVVRPGAPGGEEERKGRMRTRDRVGSLLAASTSPPPPLFAFSSGLSAER
jgi:hypothetical protein